MKLTKQLIGLRRDDTYLSGYGCDAKNVGNMLDEILDEMEEQKIKILPELLELKQYLRFKGNSKLENGDSSLWEGEVKEE